MNKVSYFAILSCTLLVMPNVVFGCTGFLNDTTEIKVYVGWPLTLKCRMAIDEIDYYDDVVKDVVSPINCIITDIQNDIQLLNVTHNTSMYDYRYDVELGDLRIDIDETTSTEFQIFINSIDFCRTLNVTLRKIELVDNESCEANLEKRHVQKESVNSGQPFWFYCEAPYDSPNTPGNLVELDDFGLLNVQVRWLFGCGTEMPNNTFIARDHALAIQNVQYSTNPGVYSCAVTYNGMTRYRNHYKLCVTPKNSHMLTARCTSQTVQIGSNVSVECHIDAGVGTTEEIGFKGYVEKISELNLYQTEHFCHDKYRDPRTNDRITCKSTRNVVQGDTCFEKIPEVYEMDMQKTKFVFVYTISNFQNSDFGDYVMTYFRLGNIHVTATFTIKPDSEEYSFNTQRLLTIVFVTLAVIALLLLLIWIFFRIEIQWIWHRVCKSREKGIKKYGAYLAYHYSKDMSETAPSLLADFITLLNSHFHKSGVQIFDSSRDWTGDEHKVGNVSLRLEDCHRVIILLTPEYIMDQWGVFEAYEAWKTAIEKKGVKIIFFAFPTTSRTIDNLPVDLKTALHQALKRNKVIHWNGKFPISRKLWMRLDILMPKLNPNKPVKLYDIGKHTKDDNTGMNREDVTVKSHSNIV